MLTTRRGGERLRHSHKPQSVPLCRYTAILQAPTASRPEFPTQTKTLYNIDQKRLFLSAQIMGLDGLEPDLLSSMTADASPPPHYPITDSEASQSDSFGC